MYTISVVIPAYNAARTIERTLSSVYSQKGDFSLEIIVVDDASTDDTLAVLEKWGKGELKIIKQEVNKGPSIARNLGITVATGKYFAFLDADDYWHPGFLKETSTFLDENPECIFAFTGQEHKTLSCTSRLQPPCLRQSLTCPKTPVILKDFFAFWKECGDSPLCTGAVLIRTDMARQTSGQLERLRLCEDLEYWCRLALLGRVAFVPKVLFVSDGIRNLETKDSPAHMQRIERFKPRWRNALGVENWGECLLPMATSVARSDGFRFVIGFVASIMVYYMLQDGRWNQAYMEYLRFRKNMPSNRMKQLMSLFGWSRCSWYVLCFFLYVRERMK